MNTETGEHPGLQRFAVATAAATLLLILAGGFVTTTATGDSISEWPFLWGRLQPGFPVEWTHRLIAMAVGFLVAGLALWAHLAEKRAWVRRLALAALGAVIAQALLGGVRIYVPQAVVSIVHACFAQAVFCAVTAVAVVLSRSWRRTTAGAETAAARRLGALTVAFAFLQLVAGAVTRHTGAGIVVHLFGAVLVLFHAALFGSRLMTTPLWRGALLLMGLLAAQLVLGLVVWGIRNSGFVRSHEAPFLLILTVTSHVVIGALVLVVTLVLTLHCFRARADMARLAAVPA